MSDAPDPKREELPFAADVLSQWSEFHEPRTLLIAVTLPDETWGAMARMIHRPDDDVSKFTASALEAYVDFILSPEKPDDDDDDDGDGWKSGDKKD